MNDFNPGWIVAIVGILAHVITATFVYGKLTQKVDNLKETVSQHKLDVKDDIERLRENDDKHFTRLDQQGKEIAYLQAKANGRAAHP
jgi:uncharacterized membrane-anchored protein YhcB (DUF1043 family)